MLVHSKHHWRIDGMGGVIFPFYHSYLVWAFPNPSIGDEPYKGLWGRVNTRPHATRPTLKLIKRYKYFIYMR